MAGIRQSASRKSKRGDDASARPAGRQTRVLAERLKELNCLYSISKVFDRKDVTLERILRRTIQVVPTAWQYSGIAGAQIMLDGKEYRTRRFVRSSWIQECPVIVQGLPVGTIAVSYSEERPEQDEGPFLKEERNLLNIIAQRLGEVIERKQSEQRLLQYQEELRSLATELALSEERERRRIAQTLHDRIGQVLAIINIRIGALLQATSSPEVAEQMREIRKLVSESISQTRSLTFDLSPPILYELGFEAALEWLSERIQQEYGVEVQVVCCRDKIDLSTEGRVTLFSAVRELLVNVGKHANSRTARVVLKKQKANILISVEDQGVGMNVARPARSKAGTDGFGLFSIRERIGFMGGYVEVSSKKDRGTCVTLVVPVQKQRKLRSGGEFGNPDPNRRRPQNSR